MVEDDSKTIAPGFFPGPVRAGGGCFQPSRFLSRAGTGRWRLFSTLQVSFQGRYGQVGRISGPGPGQYEDGVPRLGGPRFSFGTGRRLQVAKYARTPGPGTYGLKELGQGKAISMAPRWSKSLLRRRTQFIVPRRLLGTMNWVRLHDQRYHHVDRDEF